MTIMPKKTFVWAFFTGNTVYLLQIPPNSQEIICFVLYIRLYRNRHEWIITTSDRYSCPFYQKDSSMIYLCANVRISYVIYFIQPHMKHLFWSILAWFLWKFKFPPAFESSSAPFSPPVSDFRLLRGEAAQNEMDLQAGWKPWIQECFLLSAASSQAKWNLTQRWECFNA